MAEHPSVRELFLEARELEGAAREAFLDRACGEDRSLREEVEKRLEAEEQATSRQPDPGKKIVLSSGQMVGHFEIIGELGAGGMGEVYKARDSTLGREVAIKVLPTDLAGDANWLGRFAREARAASALNHPNIVTIHEFGEQDSGHCYIVMELVKGRSLRTFLTGDPLRWSQIVDLGTQIGDALARAHEAGIVHRDLKPENVMVTDDGIVKVVDFGLAKLLAPADDEEGEPTLVKTAEGQILGTPAYMSPEQIRGERIDFRTDQFSFGAVLYEMATGHRPFRASTAVDQIAAILSEESPPIRSVAPDLPLPLVWIIERCLEKKKEERYGSTRDLVKDLRNLRTLDSSSAATPLAPPARAERNGIPVTALVALAAAVTAILLAVSFTRDRSITGSAGQPFAVSVELPAGTAITSPEVMARIDISPDGRSLVISATSGGISSLWVRSLDSPRWTELPGTEGGLSPEWSPDGESIAFYGGGKVKRIAVAGGPPVDLCNASYQGKPGWAPDGTILFGAAGSAGSGIFAVSEDGGEPRQVTDIGERGDLLHAYPEILPDGEHFIYLASRTSGAGKEVEHTIWLSRLDGSEEKRFASIPSMVVFSGPESVIYARESTLLEQEFDPKELRLVGDAHVVGDDLHYFFTTGMGVFTSSLAGNIVYKRSPAPSTLLWRDRAGSSAGEVGEEAAFVSFEISPDGTRVAVAVDDPKTGSGDIWVYDTIRNTSTRLTDWPTDEIAPVWSSDGRTIFCRSDAMGPPSLFSIDAGGGELRLLRHSFTVDAPLDISPDDTTLLFQSITRATGSDLWTLPVEAPDQAEPLLQTRFWEDGARYAPDGEWIAYESNDTGRTEIYLRALGSGRSVRISPDGGSSPRWSGDGRELFYLEPDGSVMAVAADTTESVFGTPQRIFKSDVTGWWWDVAPDGERFLFLSSGSDTRTLELVVR